MKKVIAMLLGVLLDDMGLGQIGWALMMAWCIWVVLLPIILEIFEASQRRKNGK
jgi:hypothetical protein